MSETSEKAPHTPVPRATGAVPQREYPRPVLTLLILIINLGLFLAMELKGGSENSRVLRQFGALDPDLLWAGEYYRLLTAVFLHIDYVHLFSNMFALYLLGTVIEPFYGKRRFLLIYLLSGIAGNILSMFFLEGISAGASGAILGLAAAMLSRISAVKGRVPEASRKFFFFMVLFLIGMDIMLGVSMKHVNNSAHIGGFFTGWWLSFTMVLRCAPKPWKRNVGRLSTALLVLTFGVVAPLCAYQPWSADFWVARAVTFLNRNDKEHAVVALERALKIKPTLPHNSEWYQLLAQYYYDDENFEKALTYGRRAAASDPSNAHVHDWLERSYRQLGFEREADREQEIYLEKLTLGVATQNRTPNDLNNLAWALAVRDLYLEEAKKLSVASNEATGYREPVYLDTLAWVLYKQKHFVRAEEIMAEVLKLVDGPEYRYHYGAILIALGRTEEGRQMLESAIADDLHWTDRVEAEALLRSLQSV